MLQVKILYLNANCVESKLAFYLLGGIQPKNPQTCTSHPIRAQSVKNLLFCRSSNSALHKVEGNA